MKQSTPVKTFDSLFAELSERAVTRPEGSGTVAALDAGVHAQGKKVIEEAMGGVLFIDEAYALADNQEGGFGAEAAEYQSDEELSEEISQLLYWVQVLMVGRGLKLEDVYKHL